MSCRFVRFVILVGAAKIIVLGVVALVACFVARLLERKHPRSGAAAAATDSAPGDA
jgi:hypothetical protein